MKEKLILILVICIFAVLFVLVCFISAFQSKEIKTLNKKLAFAEAEKLSTYQYILDLENIQKGVTNAESSDKLLDFFNATDWVPNNPTKTNNNTPNTPKTKN